MSAEPFPNSAEPLPNSAEPSLTERVVAEIKRGGTVPAIASRTGTSEIFVKVLADHLARTGLSAEATSLCASGAGACGPNGATTDVARVACAGCFFAKR